MTVDTVSTPSTFAEQPAAVLLACARDGSQEAWTALVDRFTPLLWAIARRHRLSSADAADVVQVTWLRLVENLDHVREPSRLPGWLVTTCQREALRAIRANALCIPLDPGDPSGALARHADERGTDGPLEVALQRESATILRAALDDLPARQRRVLAELIEPTGDTSSGYADAARALDVPVGSLGPTRQRALARLRANPTVQSIGPARSRR